MTRPDDLFSYQPPPRPTARQLTDEGITRSAEHADRVRPGWGGEALALFRTYAIAHQTFRVADVRDWAYSTGFDPPTHGTAWGQVALRALRLGIVASMGRHPSPDPLCHGAWMTVWASQVFVDQDTRQ